MKAPDKIYINGFSAFCTVPDRKDDIEYIRKDTLLELLKASRKDLYNWHFHKEQECWKTYDEIIDKLRSL